MSQRSAQSSTSSQALPLQGICVADFSRVVAGPYCTMLLADMGADVIKVEHPTRGDDTRAWGPPYASSADEDSAKHQESAYFLSINRNKRSLRLDLKSEQGQALARALIRKADVLVHNFQADTATNLELDVDSIKAINPRLIYAVISSYGSTGPLAPEPGYDLLAQAATGLMSITGPTDGEPHKVGVAMVDVLAGLNAAYGIVAALYERAQTGRVRQVETSLFEAGLAGLINIASNALIGKVTPPRLGNAHPNIVPYQTFNTADEPIAIAVGNDGQFASFAKLLNQPAWAEEARFKTNAARVIYRDELIPQISDIIKRRSQKVWLEALSNANIPAAPVATVSDALSSAQAGAQSMVKEVTHPSLGQINLVSSGLKLDGQSTPMYRHPPRLGEHDDELLAELSKDAE